MLIKSQSEVRLHTGHSVHFHPSRFTRPSFRFFKGLVSRLRRRGGGGGEEGEEERGRVNPQKSGYSALNQSLRSSLTAKGYLTCDQSVHLFPPVCHQRLSGDHLLNQRHHV